MNTFNMFGREWEKLDFKPWSGPNGEGEPNAWYDPSMVTVNKKSVRLNMVPGRLVADTSGAFSGWCAETPRNIRLLSPQNRACLCGGIRLTESLGYGLYRVRLGSVLNPYVGVVKGKGDPFARQWSPRTCFAAWLDWGPDNQCEIVYECGETISDGKGAQFVVFDDPKEDHEALRTGFRPMRGLPSDIIFLWTPKRVAMFSGYAQSLDMLREGVVFKNIIGTAVIYQGAIEPNGQLLTINMRTLGPPDITKKTGVTVSGFEYLPLDSKKCIETMRRLGL